MHIIYIINELTIWPEYVQLCICKAAGMVDYRGLPWWNSRYGVGETKVRESLVYSTGETCN